jgi:hypothetical protein
MTSQGTAHGRFQRAIQRRHLLAAETAARELGGLNLTEALDLILLMRETDRWRYERAAIRWLERFIESGNRLSPRSPWLAPPWPKSLEPSSLKRARGDDLRAFQWTTPGCLLSDRHYVRRAHQRDRLQVSDCKCRLSFEARRTNDFSPS